MRSPKQIEIKDCTIRDNGRYNGILETPIFFDTYAAHGIIFSKSDNICLYNNNISGFDPHGLILARRCKNVTLIDNKFRINGEKLYYNIPVEYLYVEWFVVQLKW